MLSIKGKLRDAATKLTLVRGSGEMPAVFYGAGKETTAISVPIIEFKKVWREAGESSTVKVEVEGKNIDVLIHEVQVDPVSQEPIHADFLAIDMKKKIKVGIPLVFEGVSEAVKSGIGNLVKVLHEVEVEALPADLPHDLTVDISKLKTLEDTVTVADLSVPAGVEIVTPATDVVASVVAQVEEKEEEAAPVDLSAIEVEKKGKKEEEGEAPAEAPAE